MLPARNRLRERADFTAVVRGRGGSRSGSRLLVVHTRTAPAAQHTDQTDAAPAARVGFVVSKAVGNAVVRNTTKRRLRHIMRARVNDLPPGCDVVVRANPPAATAGYAELDAEVARLLARALAPRR